MKTRIKYALKRLATKKSKKSPGVDRTIFGRKLGLITRLIGCPHKDIGRPFGGGKTAYRSCSSCGARKPFDTETFETHRHFYSAPNSHF